MTIRDATPEDAEAILALWSRAGSVPTVSDDVESVRALIAHDPQALLVADHECVIVGTLIAGTDGWRGQFHRLAVAPEHRRRGWGRALAEAGRERLADRGIKRITLIVERDDEQAMATWQGLGFTLDGHITRFRRDI